MLAKIWSQFFPNSKTLGRVASIAIKQIKSPEMGDSLPLTPFNLKIHPWNVINQTFATP